MGGVLDAKKMANYNRDDFSAYSKNQLLDYIEQQNEQIARLETRFRDVLKAYKGIVKEKDALESSLQALTSQSMTNSTNVAHTPPRAVNNNGADSEHEQQQPSDDQLSNTEDEQDNVKSKVATLSQALSTLAQEKSKMESSFQQDKKNLLAHQEVLTRQYSDLQEDSRAQVAQLQENIEQLKNRLTEETKGRMEEEEKFSDMLKEMNELVNKERSAKESISKELQTATTELYSCKRQIANDRTMEYSGIIESLREELKKCKQDLSECEKKINEPSAALTGLQNDLMTLKEEHVKELEYERGRVIEMEQQCQLQSQQTEQRVASLESRISEMSQVIGEHESMKEKDQATVQKLRDRLTQLDIENTELTKKHLETTDRVSSETVTQISSLQEKVSKLRQLLRVATQKIFEQSTPPSNLEDMSVMEYSELLARRPSNKQYQEELSHLRTEFNTYKTRAQSVLKNKTTKEQDSSKELQEKEQRTEEMMKLIEQLKKEREEEREQHSVELQQLRKDMRQMGDSHRNEMIQSELNHKQKLQDLQSHIQTTRERTKMLLEEKDNDIAMLRGELQAKRGGMVSVSSSHGHNSTTSMENSLNSTSIEIPASISQSSIDDQSTGTAIHELLNQPSVATGDVQWFLHTQEQKRVNGEMTSLRMKRLELEDTLRDSTEREQKHLEQIDALKIVIRKLERDRTRETENFEYLKNIVLHYMCAESSSRLHLVKPIATVLHFTPNEISAVERRINRGWFSPTK